MENDVVAKKASLIWLKLIEVVSYWHQLTKNKQPGPGKPGGNTSYDHLCKAVKDCIVPVKLLFFEEVTKKLNEFMGKFICKDFRYKLCSEMAKLDFNKVNNQKPTHLVDLSFHES